MGGNINRQRDVSGTDHKTRTDDEHILEEDKQELQANPKEQPMIPKAGANPALRELREQKHGKSSPGDENG